MTGSARIIRGNALALPLADDSVDLVVTSPPYFGLRSYQDGGEHYSGQIGDEPTPAEFVDALIAATREMVRVLKPSGSIFVNLGDKMAGKSLMLLPERYRIRAVDELGLIARAVVIWSKCLSGGTHVYARVDGREKVIMVKDLARCAPGPPRRAESTLPRTKTATAAGQNNRWNKNRRAESRKTL